MTRHLENQERLIKQEKRFLKRLEEEIKESLSLLNKIEKELGMKNISILGKDKFVEILREKGIWFHGIEFYTVGFGYIETEKYVFDFIGDRYQNVKIKSEN